MKNFVQIKEEVVKYPFFNIVNYSCILHLCISIYYFVFKYKKTNLSDQLLTSYLELFIITANTNTMQHPQLSQAVSVSTPSSAALQTKLLFMVANDN